MPQLGHAIGVQAATDGRAPAAQPAPMRVEWHGRVAYRDGLALQKDRHRRVSAGLLPNTLLLLEHPPVITLGRSRGAEHVLASAASLAERGIEVVATGRGGDVTYHGPGQLMAYAIVRLEGAERDLGAFVHKLEQAVLDTARDFGVVAERVEGFRGLWVGNDKLAAIGVRMVEWVSCHGLAFNVDVDLAGFADIVACGLHGRGVTSLAKLLPRAPTLPQVAQVLAAHAARAFAASAQWADGSALPPLTAADGGRDIFL